MISYEVSNTVHLKITLFGITPTVARIIIFYITFLRTPIQALLYAPQEMITLSYVRRILRHFWNNIMSAWFLLTNHPMTLDLLLIDASEPIEIFFRTFRLWL